MSSGNSRSVGLSTQTRPVMRADEIRQMPDGTGLVVYRNVAPFTIRTIPWWERPGGQELSAAQKREAQARAERGQAWAAAQGVGHGG